MFRIEFFVEDKQLPKAMHALNGVALNLSVKPVTNAVATPKGVKQATASGTIKDKFLAGVTTLTKGTLFTSQEVKKWIENDGGATSAYNHYVKAMKDAKLAKSKGRGKFVRI